MPAKREPTKGASARSERERAAWTPDASPATLDDAAKRRVTLALRHTRHLPPRA